MSKGKRSPRSPPLRGEECSLAHIGKLKLSHYRHPPPPAGCSGGHSFVDRRYSRSGQNSSRSANWIWRSGGKGSLMTPAQPAKLLPEKTVLWGNRTFALLGAFDT